MPSILFIASHRPGRSPNQRYRFEQYIPTLEAAGFTTEISFLIDEQMDQLFYKPGHKRAKAKFILDSYRKRQRDVQRMNDFDIIFICREALMTGSTKFERKFKESRAKIIYDLDDAIWLISVSQANRKYSWLKNPEKTDKIMALADMVIAGNQHIAERAGRSNEMVHIVPSTIDMDQYQAPRKSTNGPVTIGWTGSQTTLPHFEQALPVLRRLRQRYGSKVRFGLIGDGSYHVADLELQGMPWKATTELQDLHQFDIGIMPLPQDDWSKGKCGMKGLQYMAAGIPPVMQNVGVNGRIVNDGENGFLASSEAEWEAKLSKLIEDAELRGRIGAKARQTVINDYSKQAWEQRYVALFKDLLNGTLK